MGLNTVQEEADERGVSASTIRRWVKNGAPAALVNSMTFLNSADLDAWLEAESDENGGADDETPEDEAPDDEEEGDDEEEADDEDSSDLQEELAALRERLDEIESELESDDDEEDDD